MRQNCSPLNVLFSDRAIAQLVDTHFSLQWGGVLCRIVKSVSHIRSVLLIPTLLLHRIQNIVHSVDTETHVKSSLNVETYHFTTPCKSDEVTVTHPKQHKSFF